MINVLRTSFSCDFKPSETFITRPNLTRALSAGLLPEDGDAEVVPGCDVGGFDVVAEQDQRDEQVVDVGLVNREEYHGHVLLSGRDGFS